MKKLLFLSAVLLFMSISSLAQSDMIIHKSENSYYLEHKVAAKENFYSIGRLYNAHPKEIAAYNKLDMSKGLSLGQMIRIPLGNNFSQSVDEGVPVYYKVGEKEGLMKVSAAANNVTLSNLRRWNKLDNDNIAFGHKLIVGYLVSPVAVATTPTEKKDPVIAVKNEPVVLEKKQPEPIVVKQQEPANKGINNLETKQPEAKAVVKEEKKVVPIGKDGYFKESYSKQTKSTPPSKNETVTSGIFKTTSGWQDAKYYLLITGVTPGIIVKVTNPTNSKVVYAKVLGEMSSIPQNEGYRVRISNAAALALDIAEDDKFIVKINY